jgi:hypothetical protein
MEQAHSAATDPQAFSENVAHVSYVRRASVNGTIIPPSDYHERLKFLEDETSGLVFTGRLEIVVDFAATDEIVREVTAESIHASEPSTLTITLLGTDGRVVHAAAFRLERDRPIEIESILPPGSRVNQMRIAISTAQSAHAWLTDVRVQGQTPALERYIERTLRFPAPVRERP